MAKSLSQILHERREACPNRAEHTDQPDGYFEAWAWADSMLITHTQHVCEGCNLYVIWRPIQGRDYNGMRGSRPSADDGFARGATDGRG